MANETVSRTTIDDTIESGDTKKYEVDTKQDGAVRADIQGDASDYDVDIETTPGTSVEGSATVESTLPEPETVEDTDQHTVGTKGVSRTTAVSITNNSGSPTNFVGSIDRNSYLSPESDDQFIREGQDECPVGYIDGRKLDNSKDVLIDTKVDLPGYDDTANAPNEVGTFNHITGDGPDPEGLYFRSSSGLVGLGLTNLASASTERYIVYRSGDDAVALDTETNTLIASDPSHESVVQSALDSLPAGRGRRASVGMVGEFTFSSDVNMPDNSALNLRNTYIEADGDNSLISIFGSTNVEIYGGVLDGSNQPDGVLNHLISSVSSDEVSVSDVRVQNAGREGIRSGESNEVVISGCRAVGCHTYGVVIRSTEPGRGVDNTVRGCVVDSTSASQSACYRVGAESGADRLDTVIADSVAKNSAGWGFNFQDTSGNSNRVKVSSCISVNNADHGIRVNDMQGVSLDNIAAVSNGGDGFNISGRDQEVPPEEYASLTECRSVDNGGVGYDILVVSAALSNVMSKNNGGDGIQFRGSKHVRASNLFSFDATDTDFGRGVNMTAAFSEGVEDVVIDGLYVDNCAVGIHMASNGDVTIEDGEFTNCDTNIDTSDMNADGVRFRAVDGVSLTDLPNGAKYDGMVQESANAETPQGTYDAATTVDFTDSGDGSGDGVYIIDAAGSPQGPL